MHFHSLSFHSCSLSGCLTLQVILSIIQCRTFLSCCQLLLLKVCQYNLMMLFIKWSTTSASGKQAVTTVASIATLVLLLSLVGVSEALTPAEMKWPSCDANRMMHAFKDCLNILDKSVKEMRFGEGNQHFVRQCCSIREFGDCLNNSVTLHCVLPDDRVSFVVYNLNMAQIRYSVTDPKVCDVEGARMVDCIFMEKASGVVIIGVGFLVLSFLLFCIIEKCCGDWFFSKHSGILPPSVRANNLEMTPIE